jgi:hypothetical protein
LFASLHPYADLSADLRLALWYLYLVAAVMLPVHHLRPILKYLRGRDGIGDACIRTEAIQCGWRVPALLFSIFVAPSLPLFLSIFLDLVGRIGRVLAMQVSQRRWSATAPTPGVFGDAIPITPSHRSRNHRETSNDHPVQTKRVAIVRRRHRPAATPAAATRGVAPARSNDPARSRHRPFRAGLLRGRGSRCGSVHAAAGLRRLA